MNVYSTPAEMNSEAAAAASAAAVRRCMASALHGA